MRIALSLVVALSMSTLACTDVCGVRGGPDVYVGAETFVVSVGANGTAGAQASTATLDWDPYEQRRDEDWHSCADLVSVSVDTETCHIDADLTSIVFDDMTRAHVDSRGHLRTSSVGGHFISATAIVTGGACVIPIAGKPTTVALVSGSIDWDDQEIMRVDAIGTGGVTVGFTGQTSRHDSQGCSVPVRGRGGPEGGTLVLALAVVVLGWRRRSLVKGAAAQSHAHRGFNSPRRSRS